MADDERASETCLHCEINDLVQEHVERHPEIDAGEIAARLAESFADLILSVAEDQQGKLFAAALAHLSHAFLEKGDEKAEGHDRRH